MKLRCVKFNRRSTERGVALLLALFVVALASIIVVNLTYSSYIGSRLNNATVQALQAEYLLKSAVNMARTLLYLDKSRDDSLHDIWGPFTLTQTIPNELLGVNFPELLVEVEITPEASKMPLRKILTRAGGTVDPKWRYAISSLFRHLGFDDDKEKDHTGIFKDEIFDAEQLTAMLIDYSDEDSESYDDGAEFASGREGELPKDFFPNRRIKRIGELATIPGFTPDRMRRLTPLVTVFDRGVININLAPKVIIESLHEDITPSIADAIVEFRRAQPFDNTNKAVELTNILGEELYQEIGSMIGVESRWFEVLAKVAFGPTTYFLRSFISKSGDGELPVIRQVELFY